MNKPFRGLFAGVLFATMGFAFSAVAADWVYDGTYVSNGTWTFKATVDANDKIYFGIVITNTTLGVAVPTSLSPLDLSTTVRNSDSTKTYTIARLGNNGDTWGSGFIGCFGANQDSPTCYSVAPYLGEVTLPGEGLTEIANAAFCKCSNMSGTIRFPNSLTKLGNNAFYQVNGSITWENAFPSGVTYIGRNCFNGSSLDGDIVISSASDFTAYSTFSGTKITSVTFGDQNLTFGGGYNAGTFRNCTELTNVTFGAGMTAGNLKCGGCFTGCTNLKELDLRGFSKLGNSESYPPLSSSIEKVLISSNLTSLTTTFFNGATKLKEVHFYGPIAKSVFGAPLFGNLSASQAIVSYVHFDKDDPNYASHRTTWDANTNDGTINGTTSIWHSDIAGANYTSRMLLAYGEEEKPGELGYWIFDGEHLADTNGLWAFSATLAGTALAIGECSQNPSAMSELDLTRRVTDAQGHALIITSLDPKFSTVSGSYGNPGTAQHGAEYVGLVTLPTNSLVSIGACAFAQCSNLTNVWPLLPDSVTTIGTSAFNGTKISGLLRLKGLTIARYGVFKNTKVDEVVFGPSLTEFDSAWGCSTFENCTSITNVIFDPASRISTFVGSTQGPFTGCSNLSGTNGVIDISSFTTIGDTYPVFPRCPIETLIFGTNITTFKSGFFNVSYGYGWFTKLSHVKFLGAPPAALSGVTGLFTGVRNDWSTGYKDVLLYPTNTATSVCTEIPYAERDAWAQYAEGGVIRAKGTYWKAEYVGGDDFYRTRPLIYTDHKDLGLTIFLR